MVFSLRHGCSNEKLFKTILKSTPNILILKVGGAALSSVKALLAQLNDSYCCYNHNYYMARR